MLDFDLAELYEVQIAFTQLGVAMISGILKSDKEINVNIAIMTTFVFMRKYAYSHKNLSEKLEELEDKYYKQFKDVYKATYVLLKKEKQETTFKERKRIGYK